MNIEFHLFLKVFYKWRLQNKKLTIENFVKSQKHSTWRPSLGLGFMIHNGVHNIKNIHHVPNRAWNWNFHHNLASTKFGAKLLPIEFMCMKLIVPWNSPYFFVCFKALCCKDLSKNGNNVQRSKHYNWLFCVPIISSTIISIISNDLSHSTSFVL